MSEHDLEDAHGQEVGKQLEKGTAHVDRNEARSSRPALLRTIIPASRMRSQIVLS